MTDDSHLADEVDMLEQLCGGPMSLAIMVSIFRDTERARRALRFLAAERKIEFFVIEGHDEHVLQQWEIRELLETLGPTTSEHIRLRLTAAGHESFVRDSKGFFDRLFSR